MCTKKTHLFPLTLMVLPIALSSPVITTFNFIHGSLRRHRLYEQHGSGISHPAFHYSLFSFSVRDSFLSGSHLESIECLFPAGRCERGVVQQQGYGNLVNRADKKKRLPLHKLPAFSVDTNHSMFLLTMVVHLNMQRYLYALIPELLHSPFTFPTRKMPISILMKRHQYMLIIYWLGQHAHFVIASGQLNSIRLICHFCTLVYSKTDAMRGHVVQLTGRAHTESQQQTVTVYIHKYFCPLNQWPLICDSSYLRHFVHWLIGTSCVLMHITCRLV